MRLQILGFGVAAALALAAPSYAGSGGVKIGTLSCHVNGGWGLVLGSSRDLACTFSGAGDKVEHYRGSISKFGVDIGYKHAGVMVWTVFAPAADVGPGALAGHYGGATAGAAVGVGVGANALLGGFNNSFALQPLSIEGSTGLNVAAGVAGMSLKSATS
jgi:hypothetical protein